MNQLQQLDPVLFALLEHARAQEWGECDAENAAFDHAIEAGYIQDGDEPLKADHIERLDWLEGVALKFLSPRPTHYALVITAGSTKMYISSTRADVSDTVQGALIFEFGRDNPSLKAFTYERATGMPCQIVPLTKSLEIAGDTYTPAPFGAK